jgi:hypothetical protein
MPIKEKCFFLMYFWYIRRATIEPPHIILCKGIDREILIRQSNKDAIPQK